MSSAALITKKGQQWYSNFVFHNLRQLVGILKLAPYTAKCIKFPTWVEDLIILFFFPPQNLSPVLSFFFFYKHSKVLDRNNLSIRNKRFFFCWKLKIRKAIWGSVNKTSWILNIMFLIFGFFFNSILFPSRNTASLYIWKSHKESEKTFSFTYLG